eukprot:Gb_33031 [translate_table: standard]
MVKFSKQLEAQLIPEWKGAFVNYWQLKKDVKKIKLLRKKSSAKDSAGHHDVPAKFNVFGCSTFAPITDYLRMKTRAWIHREREPDIIQIRRRIRASTREDVYETELFHLFEEADAAKAFFARLDEQLNKVNQFYRSKEAEFLERGETLKRQMQILIDLKAVLREQRLKKSLSGSSSGSSRSGSGSSPRRSSDESSAEWEVDGQDQNDIIAAFEKNGVTFVDSPTRFSTNRSKSRKENGKLCMTKAKVQSGKGGIGGVQGKHMKVDIPATTASRTISAITQMLWEDLVTQSKKDALDGKGNLHINKKKVQHAEKMIRGAFVELYRGLGLLKTYRVIFWRGCKLVKSINAGCLTTPMVTGQKAAPVYLKAVERSYFNSSDKDDRRKAMKFLRPKQIKDSHAVTFFIGLFTGCFLALFVGYAILAHISGMYTDPTHSGYIEMVYPVFSMLALLNLHIFLYGCNIFMWRCARINYSFIFEFSPNTELKYRDVFLICASSMTVVVGGMVAHLTLRAKGFSPMEVDTIPGILLLIFTGLLICPFDIFYRSSRICFLKVIRNIILAPLYKVVMTDFFMADQLTSQVPLLRYLEFIACYYLAGSFRTHDYGACTHNKLYREMAYVISFLPYYWRAMQCARRWFDEGDVNHLKNLGKYVSAMFAAGARLTYALQPNSFWLALVVITSTIATIYQLYWDFVKDWGFLNPGSRNPWLRDELILKHKIVYFISIALNFVLRLAWVETVMHLNLGRNGYRVTDFLLASLEVIRRGHWNFYRLENEHLNNVGKFRAVKTVPLPFRELDHD